MPGSRAHLSTNSSLSRQRKAIPLVEAGVVGTTILIHVRCASVDIAAGDVIVVPPVRGISTKVGEYIAVFVSRPRAILADSKLEVTGNVSSKA